MNLKFPCTFLFLALAAAIVTPSSSSRIDDAQPLKATTELISQRSCIQEQLKNTYSVTQTLRVTVLNHSKGNLIVDKSIGRGFYGMVVARDARSLSEEKYEWNPQLDWSIEPPPGELVAEKPVSPFVVLAPAESFQFETNFWVWARIEDSAGPGIPSGDHVLQLQIGSWYYTTKPEEVQKRWQSYGDLIYKLIKTEPLAFSLPKDPKPENCKR
jgi:hypothetical protein